MSEPISLSKVAVGYRRKRPVLEDVTLDARPGTVTGLLDRNGAGKTTLTRPWGCARRGAVTPCSSATQHGTLRRTSVAGSASCHSSLPISIGSLLPSVSIW